MKKKLRIKNKKKNPPQNEISIEWKQEIKIYKLGNDRYEDTYYKIKSYFV